MGENCVQLILNVAQNMYPQHLQAVDLNVTKLISYILSMGFIRYSLVLNVMMILANSLYLSRACTSTQFNQLQTAKEIMCSSAPRWNTFTLVQIFHYSFVNHGRTYKRNTFRSFSQYILNSTKLCKDCKIWTKFFEILQTTPGNLELDMGIIVDKLESKIFANVLGLQSGPTFSPAWTGISQTCSWMEIGAMVAAWSAAQSEVLLFMDLDMVRQST